MAVEYAMYANNLLIYLTTQFIVCDAHIKIFTTVFATYAVMISINLYKRIENSQWYNS